MVEMEFKANTNRVKYGREDITDVTSTTSNVVRISNETTAITFTSKDFVPLGEVLNRRPTNRAERRKLKHKRRAG